LSPDVFLGVKMVKNALAVGGDYRALPHPLSGLQGAGEGNEGEETTERGKWREEG